MSPDSPASSPGLSRSVPTCPERRDPVVVRCFWLGLALYALVGLAFWVRSDWRTEWDSALYLLLGKSLAAGQGYAYLDQPFFLRPPGFPWLLSLAARSGKFDDLLLNRLVLAFAVAAVAAAFTLLRRLHGAHVAAAVSALLATSPLFLSHLNWVVAELPFLALLLLGFVLFLRGSRSASRWWLWSFGGAVALAAAVHLRTVGLVALPALLLAGRGERGPVAVLRRALPILVITILSLPWLLHAHRAAAAAAAPSEQLLLFSYSTALFHLDPGDPGSPGLQASDWLARILENGRELALAVAGALTGSQSGWSQGLILLLLLLGAVAAWRAGPSPLDGFGLVYTGVVLSYFTFDPRLLVPLLPCLYLYTVLGIESAARVATRALGRTLPRAALLAGVAIVLAVIHATQLPAALRPGEKGRDSHSTPQASEDERRIARWIVGQTRPEARILAGQAPVLSLLSGHRVYSYLHARGTGLLDRFPSDFVIVEPGIPSAVLVEVRDRGAPFATIPLLGGSRSAIVYRVAPLAGD